MKLLHVDQRIIRTAAFIADRGIYRNIRYSFRQAWILKRTFIHLQIQPKRRKIFPRIFALRETIKTQCTRSFHIIEILHKNGRHQRQKVLEIRLRCPKLQIHIITFLQQSDKSVQLQKKCVKAKLIIFKGIFRILQIGIKIGFNLHIHFVGIFHPAIRKIQTINLRVRCQARHVRRQIARQRMVEVLHLRVHIPILIVKTDIGSADAELFDAQFKLRRLFRFGLSRSRSGGFADIPIRFPAFQHDQPDFRLLNRYLPYRILVAANHAKQTDTHPQLLDIRQRILRKLLLSHHSQIVQTQGEIREITKQGQMIILEINCSNQAFVDFAFHSLHYLFLEDERQHYSHNNNKPNENPKDFHCFLNNSFTFHTI